MCKKKLKLGLISCIFLVSVACVTSALDAGEKSPADIIITSCGERKTVINSLHTDYKEVQNSIGVSNGGGLIEIYVSPKGSFSITVTNPSEITCIISAGEYWNNGKNVASKGS